VTALLLEQMTMPELDALDRDRTLIAIPVSPLEAHGPHLPLGTDGFMASQMADGVLDLLAERRPDWTYVRTPWLPVGCYTLRMPGSVEVPQHTVRELVTAYGRALARQGFGHIIVTNGHGGPGHGAAIEEACRQVSRRRGVQMNYPLGRVLTDVMKGKLVDRIAHHLGRPLSDEEQQELAHDFHAGRMETSLALDHHPELVKGDPAELPPVHHSMVGMMRYWWGDLVGRGPGYMGYPGKASPEIGQALEKAVVGAVADLVERMMDGEDLRRVTASEFYRNPLFRTRARWLTRSLDGMGRGVTALRRRIP
jgi:creatinine amidohydrolase